VTSSSTHTATLAQTTKGSSGAFGSAFRESLWGNTNA